ncbi:hypothetical protein B0H17DRAFT_469068 [Mycena rosella]|uniref:Uncharacterized protein n=1 Tax=Mycena rosella TaxID=1033263 RepID=A0AAD7C6L2_MYCRO|nr:hypothetical protein B0H17DRAFT_469068 [Mycena rosella]
MERCHTQRETLSQNDFPTAGSSRSDVPWSVTLQFSPPPMPGASSASAPLNAAELTCKQLPAFYPVGHGGRAGRRRGRRGGVPRRLLRLIVGRRVVNVGGPTAMVVGVGGVHVALHTAQDSGTITPFKGYPLAPAPAVLSGTRRCLRSLFTPAELNGGKPWTQAATLNGCS